MLDCRIGFYVHHHGRGHAHRVQQILPHLQSSAYVFGTDLSAFANWKGTEVVCHTLPPDTDNTKIHTEDWPDVLHYAPLGISQARQRTHDLVHYFNKYALDLLVVDVSVEVALLARLCGIPTIYSRQHGYRQDAAHQAAFQSATSLLAPYPKTWEEPETPNWVQKKTFYAGGFSRLDDQDLTKEEAKNSVGMAAHEQHVVVMIGFGGSNQSYDRLEETARQNTQYQWWVLGPVPPPPNPPDNLVFLGTKSNPYPYLKGANVVVAAAGNNTVIELAQLKSQYICIPEARPFDEQLSKARILARKNAALVLPNWSEPRTWGEHLRQVTKTDVEALHSIIVPDAAQKAARHIEEIALSQRAGGSAVELYS